MLSLEISGHACLTPQVHGFWLSLIPGKQMSWWMWKVALEMYLSFLDYAPSIELYFDIDVDMIGKVGHGNFTCLCR